MSDLLGDLRYAVRLLRLSPAFAVTGVLTLALGIGAITALFSVVNGVLINPLPYPDSDRVMAIYGDAPGFPKAPISYLNFLDWQRSSRTFARMAIYRNQDYNFTGANPAERLSGSMVSSEFFGTLAVPPVIGRDFTTADDRPGAAPVAILGGGFWMRQFGASPAALGAALTLNGVAYTIVGVTPRDFAFYGAQRDVYTPIGQWTDPSFRDRGVEMSAYAIGRLAPAVTGLQAASDMQAIARTLAQAYPGPDSHVGIAVLPLKQDIVGSVRPFLLVLLAAVAFLLLITCVNVANLLLARATGRSREFAVRTALGASPARVLRQVLTESAVLAVVGGTLGLLLAMAGTKTIVQATPHALPRAGDVSVDARVLLFAAAVSLLAALFFGLVPALNTRALDVRDVLNASGRGSSGGPRRQQRILVALEVSLTFVLLVGAGLMLRTLQALWHVNPGFTPHDAVTFSVSLPSSRDTTSADTRARLRQFDNTLREVPGVEAASVTLGARPMIHDTTLPFWIEGRAKPANLHDMPQAMCYLVEAGFRQAMGLTLQRGRFVTAQDDEHADRVVDIDEAFARQFFPDQDPLGQRVNIRGFDVQARIVGVVGHIQQWRLDGDPRSAIEAQMFYPFMQLPEKLMPLAADAVAVVLRTSHDPTDVMRGVRRAVNQVQPGDVIYGVETMEDVVASSFAARRLSMILFEVFGTIALLLACVGIYGVVACLVGQRTREIGVRLALGAQRGQVMRLVLAQGAGMALVGTGCGAVAALGLTRLLTAQLFGVAPRDVLTFAGVGAVLMTVAVAASYGPGRRAMRVDPAVSLRAE